MCVSEAKVKLNLHLRSENLIRFASLKRKIKQNYLSIITEKSEFHPYSANSSQSFDFHYPSPYPKSHNLIKHPIKNKFSLP